MFRRRLALLSLLVVVAGAPSALAWKDRPLGGDPVNGEKLWSKATKKPVKVDGAFVNSLTDDQAAKALQLGKVGFPKLATESSLDRHDVVAYVRSKNVDIRDLIPEDTTHVLIAEGKYDKFALDRLKERASLENLDKKDQEHRVFVLYDIGEPEADVVRVRTKQTKMRDRLKPKTKVGYAVVMPLAGVGDGGYEVGFVVDNDIRITAVEVRAADGTRPDELNRAAARLVGRGARGKYDGLRLVGAGKAVRELEDSISRAFLLGMEAVYMYEVAERDYFAFDTDD